MHSFEKTTYQTNNLMLRCKDLFPDIATLDDTITMEGTASPLSSLSHDISEPLSTLETFDGPFQDQGSHKSTCLFHFMNYNQR